MYCNLFDSHLHSKNSPDGRHSIIFLAETAVEKGFQGISVTDHCDGDAFEKEQFDTRIMHSAIDAAIAREAFGFKLIISFGIEVGQVFFNKKKIENVLKKHRFDFILGSLHMLKYEDFDFYKADYKALSSNKMDEYIYKYFEELLELVCWGKFDVVAHINYPWRYMEHQGVEVDLMKYRENMDEVLKKMVDKGIGLELNVSGLRHNIGTLPPMWVIKRYRELGGEIVTIGSDAHSAESLGEGIEYGMKLLQDSGFTHFAFFSNRKPVMLKII